MINQPVSFWVFSMSVYVLFMDYNFDIGHSLLADVWDLNLKSQQLHRFWTGSVCQSVWGVHLWHWICLTGFNDALFSIPIPVWWYKPVLRVSESRLFMRSRTCHRRSHSGRDPTLTSSCLCVSRHQILDEIAEHGIRIYQLPDADSDEDEEFKEQTRVLKVRCAAQTCFPILFSMLPPLLSLTIPFCCRPAFPSLWSAPTN